jgi:multiple sugar transport system permease protein
MSVTTPRASGPARASGHRRRSVLTHAALVAGALVMLYPVVWMVASSVKSDQEIFSSPGLWPDELVLGNYAQGWTALGVQFGRFFVNSFVVSALAVVGNVASCSMAAYAFARLSFRHRRLFFALMLMSIMLPIHVLIVPQYVLFQNLGWVGTFLPLTVPKFLAVDGFFVFLLVQFIRSLPRELDDAARIDGCGPVQIYWRIIVPLSAPALVTCAIFTFIWTWDDFFSQLVYLTDVDTFTVPLALRAFLDSSGTSSWGPMFAMAVLSLVPILVFFLVFQRRITEGISTTGMKG